MGNINFRANPFYLDEEGIEWVKNTFDNMTLEEKCGQVFCPMGFSSEEEVLKTLYPEGRCGRYDVPRRHCKKHTGYT